MSGVETVNDEFEVGFNQTFESHWYRAEQAGRVIMVLFVLAAGLGLLGRGPFSHSTTQSAGGALSVDYEPIARHGTNTTITVHLKKPADVDRPIELRVNQQIIEPMGYQRSVPLANSSSSVSDAGMRLTFNEAANQPDVLVRFELMPNAVGLVPLHVSDGSDTIDWSILVVP
ncbi:MAG: hypothetical protein ABSC06_03200 [Rhodopila sp.]|jgi:hypothetical protein